MFAAPASLCRAEIIAEDTFAKYPAGEAPLAMGGQGWQGKWHIGSEVKAVIETASDAQGESRNCLKLSGGTTMKALIRRIAHPEKYAGQPIYLRVRFQIEDPKGASDMFANWRFCDQKGYQTELPGVVTALRRAPSVRFGEASKNLPIRLVAGEFHTLIAKLGNWDETKNSYTSLSLWMDPQLGTAEDGQPHAAQLEGLSAGGQVELLYLRTHDFAEGYYRFFDVRLATTWDEVAEDR